MAFLNLCSVIVAGVRRNSKKQLGLQYVGQEISKSKERLRKEENLNRQRDKIRLLILDVKQDKLQDAREIVRALCSIVEKFYE